MCGNRVAKIRFKVFVYNVKQQHGKKRDFSIVSHFISTNTIRRGWYVKLGMKLCRKLQIIYKTLLISQKLKQVLLVFWHRSFTFNSSKSPTWCNNFSVYYPDVCLQFNMIRAFSRPSSVAQWLQWQPLVLHSYRGDSRAVFVVRPDGRENARNMLRCK
jgi:hypothetical protein